MPRSRLLPQVRQGLSSVCLLLLTICGGLIAPHTAPNALAQATFEEVSAELGIAHQWDGELFELAGVNFGGGVAMEDYDNDGDIDLFLGNATGTPMAVYRNDGGAFTNISDTVGIGDIGSSKQILFGDLDNNGWRDLIVLCWGRQTRLFVNDQAGGFVDMSAGSGLERVIDENFHGKATGGCLGDYDRDGDLDLHVSYWKAGAWGPECTNALYRNNGDFLFTELASDAGVANQRKSFQSVFTDLNGDLWPDLVVAQDKEAGITYYQNNGDGSFEDRSEESGLDGWVSIAGAYADAMGLAVGDTDNDGDLEVFATNVPQGNPFYRNDGGGFFTEMALQNGTVNLRGGWGATFFDCDNDGWQDLYVVCYGKGMGTGIADNRLYANTGLDTFVDIAPDAQVDDPGDGYSIACGDLNNDGYVDMVISQWDVPTLIYRNAGGSNNWLRLRTQGTVSNRDGIGALILVSAGGITQTREVGAGQGYLGHHSLVQEFGLGGATSVDRIEVRWPSGTVDVHADFSLINVQARLVEAGNVSVSNRVRSFRARAANDGAVELGWEVLGEGRLALDRERNGRWETIARALPLSGELIDRPEFTGFLRYRLVDKDAGQLLQETVVELAGDHVPAQLRLGEPVPNPFNPRVQLFVEVPARLAGEPSLLEILDARGQRVAVLHRGALPAGSHPFEWNGEDADGHAVASGVYQAVVRVGRMMSAQSMTLLR